MKVAMIGAGGWGTAMMISLAARHDDLFMYCRNPETAQDIQKSRENKNYLPGCRIPLHVKITSSLETAVKGAGCVILCTPSHAVEAMAESLVPWLEKDTVVVCASKGLADHAGHRLSEVITDKVKGITKRSSSSPGRTMLKKSAVGCRVRPSPLPKCRKRCRWYRTFS